MRLVVWVLLGAVLLGLGRPSDAAPGLPLHECRLPHPLRLDSVAARCGRLAVPEDPSRSDGPTIDLHVAVVPALDRRSTAAPLFLLAGGPGQAASDLYVSFAGALALINRTHDLVMVDQRGTGLSAPLACAYPDDWQDSTEALPALREATRTCLARWGDRVRNYTTSVAVGDLERVRLALGYAVIDLYGSSYGTRVAQHYLRRHPAATQAVILDGVTYPEQTIGPDTPADGERALSLIVDRCQADVGCHAAYPTLAAELAGLRQRFGPEQRSLTIDDPGTGVPFRFVFNRAVLNAALRFLSYNSTEASLLPTLIHEAAAGHLAPLASQPLLVARQIAGQLASGMQNTVICSEDAPGFGMTTADRQRMSLTYQGTDQIDALEDICKIWPQGPVDGDLHAPLASDVPVLLLSGEADPVTPPADAEHAARGLRNHRHLVLAGEGHGQLATGCVPALMSRFLEHPDPRALDAGCLDRHRPAPFFVAMTGPAP